MPFSEAVKASVRKKALGRCCICWTPGVHIHHIIPQAENGPDTEDNAAPLCPTCHDQLGANPEKRSSIREFRDNWNEWVANRPILVQYIVDQPEVSWKLNTFDDFEQHILQLSASAPMAAFLQLYEGIEQQIRILGKALGMQRTEVWNLAVGVQLLKCELNAPHEVVQKTLNILETYAELHAKTIMPDEADELVTEQDFLSNVSLGLKLPRLIRDSMRFIPVDETKPKAWPFLDQPLGQ